MATPTAYRYGNGSVPLAHDTSITRSPERTRADGPNINLEGLSNDRPVTRVEIAVLNTSGRTELMMRLQCKPELPRDVVDALTREPEINADNSRVIAAALTPPETFHIPPADLRSLIVVKEQTGGGTAVQTEQDQQDCCNCCNLQ